MAQRITKPLMDGLREIVDVLNGPRRDRFMRVCALYRYEIEQLDAHGVELLQSLGLGRDELKSESRERAVSGLASKEEIQAFQRYMFQRLSDVSIRFCKRRTCGDAFVVQRSDAKYCCASCRSAKRRGSAKRRRQYFRIMQRRSRDRRVATTLVRGALADEKGGT